MEEYVKMFVYGDNIGISFNNEMAKPFAIGERMNELCEDAYMNGYNWDALFNYYLSKHAPELLEGLDTDPEAGSYAAYYTHTPENKTKAERFVELIRNLIEHEEELYRLVQEEGGEIEWD